MDGTELHVQADIWKRRHDEVAVLLMEGEAPDRSNGGGVAVDALYRVALARGLPFTTDLDRLSLRPVPGWRLLIDQASAVTLMWPRFPPLLAAAPLDLPPGWGRLATQRGVVALFVGYGLGLHEHAGAGQAQPITCLPRLAASGALAAGAVQVLDQTASGDVGDGAVDRAQGPGRPGRWTRPVATFGLSVGRSARTQAGSGDFPRSG